MPEADLEKLTVITPARGHQGEVEVAGQRTPGLGTGEDETAIALLCFQCLPGGLGGEDAPGGGRRFCAGFGENGQGIAVRLQDAGHCQVPLGDRTEHRPAAGCLPAAGLRQPHAVVCSELQRGADVLASSPAAMQQRSRPGGHA